MYSVVLRRNKYKNLVTAIFEVELYSTIHCKHQQIALQ